MNCKFCNAEISEEHKFCPFCGKALVDAQTPAFSEMTDTVAVEEAVSGEVPAEVSAASEPMASYSEEFYDEPQPQKPKKKVWPLVLAIVGAVLALGVLAVVLLMALGVEFKLPQNDIYRREVYSVEDEKVLKEADTVVARINDKELTNAQLQIYYRMQVSDFVNYYSSYLSYIGFDYTQPLSEQTCYFDETMTWEQYFVDIAIQTWQNNQTMALLAEEAGFALSEDWQAEFDALPEELETQAAEGGYENAEAMIQDILGPACSVEDYAEYIELVSLRGEFYASEYERLMPTTEEIEAYFAENEASFTENGITKESGLVSNVRHILVCPEGGTTDESGNTTYSDDEWAACLQKAEDILAEWKAGEATEESFAALVATYTEDTGSATTGGLYENINPTSSYVENFLNWSVDMTRQTGDTGIVQSDYGYHIMYFVSGEAYWLSSARTQLLSERITAILDEAKEKWPMEVTYRKIALSELEFA